METYEVAKMYKDLSNEGVRVFLIRDEYIIYFQDKGSRRVEASDLSSTDFETAVAMAYGWAVGKGFMG